MAWICIARARWLLLSACMLTNMALTADEASAIPFRASGDDLGRQAGLAIGVTLLLLALAAAALLGLRRRLNLNAPAETEALRRIASLRLPPQTRVHLIAYRDREWLLVQAGDALRCLPAGATCHDDSDAHDARAAANAAGAKPQDAS